MCYGKTNYTPGRYLEDGLRAIGVTVELYTKTIDFAKVDLSECAAVLFVESPSKPSITVKNIGIVKIPKLFWIHHGENRLTTNTALAKRYQADIVLMAHSLHLANRFTAPTRLFPFAMAKDIYNVTTALKNRNIDIASVGSKDVGIYHNRRLSISRLKEKFGDQYNLSFDGRVFLAELAKKYGNAKIVFNHSANGIKSLNMRLFEGMGCGALVISDYVPPMEELFTEGKHYIRFKNHEELISKVEYYLTHLDEAQEIATAGYNHLLNNHTYEHRAEQICKIIEELNEG